MLRFGLHAAAGSGLFTSCPDRRRFYAYGSGTADDPYIYLWDPEDTLSDERMLAMFAPNISPANPEHDQYEPDDSQYDDYGTDDISDPEINNDSDTSL